MTVDDFQTKEGCYSCPTCDSEHDSPFGLKQHHAKAHGESLVETAECQWCGDEFKVRPSQEGNFCSKECQMERRKSEGLEARKRRVDITCKGCGELFEVKRSRVDARAYCSDECREADSNAKVLECEQCGSDFRRTGKYADEARFCSQDCYGDHIHENEVGENSQHWQGGTSDGYQRYGPGWGEYVRRKVRNRDQRRCTECGATEAEQLAEYDQQLHVHHLVDPTESTNPAVYNAPRNLVSLCTPCHLGDAH